MTGPFLCDTLSILNFAYLILQFWQNSILQGLIFTISTDKYAKEHEISSFNVTLFVSLFFKRV